MNRTDTIPQWLLEPEEQSGLQFNNRHIKKSKKNFITKTLMQLSDTVRNEFLSEMYTKKDGLLQKLDPRIKLITFVALTGFTTLTRSVSVLIVIYLFTLLLIFLSKLPFLKFIKRIWIFMPLVTAIMVLPAIFNVIVPGRVLLIIHEFDKPIELFGIQFPQTLSITQQGIISGVVLILRVSISVSLGLILTATTPWARLMKSLRLIKIPAIFITMLDMAYRYIAVLIKISIEIFEARNLRTIGKISHSSNKQFASNSIGVLFTKSMGYSENVYMAMVSRGFTGQVETISPFKFMKLDFIWLFAIILFMIVLYVFS
ncbi:MAG: cobalt/nickel transport system permease protein [Petroclostridium sp.]|jgi:cobalt/nickel transport system permease protein|nr:cobalt transporter component CbiQ [Clostridia bacterium]MDK2810476.1 cobalt/nickel transport system permease protein [Petroclostridium sp.]